MRHLTEGALRRVHDDGFAVSNRERAHLDTCARCQQRTVRIGEDAAFATRLLAGVGDEGVSTEAALGRLRQRVAAGASPGHTLATPPHVTRRRWVLGAIAVPVVTAGLVVSANAAGWLSVFSPTKVAPVAITVGDLSGLPDLSAYGSMHLSHVEPRTVADAAHAAAATGLKVLDPTLPADVPAHATWEVIGNGSATFTLDAAKAAAAAGRAGRAAPPVPASLDGVTVTVNAGPAVVVVYGGAAGTSGDPLSSMPTLVIAESVRPTASTNGATLQQLEDFLVAQPGVSPQLAAEIRVIGNASSTLPIPIIAGLMTSQTISIDGVQGVVTGDSTGLGTAVIWEKDGVVYAVGGLLSQNEVVDIARSLP